MIKCEIESDSHFGGEYETGFGIQDKTKGKTA